MIKTSIVLPVYNSEKTISKTLKSILNQDYNNFELLLINDGSEDNSGKICEEIALKDNRIQVFHQKNKGPGAARNKGIKEAKGKYLTFVDSDDIVNSSWLSSMIDEQIKDDVDLVITGYNRIIGNNEKLQKCYEYVPERNMYNKLELENNIEKLIDSRFFNSLCNKLYKYKIIRTNNIFINEEFDLSEDFLFNLSYISKCNSVSILDTAKYNIIVNDKSLTHTYRENKFELLDKVDNKYRLFLNENDIDSQTADFNTIRRCYSCFMDLFHEDNKMKFNEKIESIKKILNKKKVSEITSNYETDDFKEWVLVLPLRLKLIYLIYLLSLGGFIKKFKLRRY